MRQENVIFKRHYQDYFYAPTLTKLAKVDNLLKINVLYLGCYGEMDGRSTGRLA